MTFVYDLHSAKHSITVPDEAVRGLHYNGTNWVLLASDPTVNAISHFRVPGILAQKAAEELELKRPLNRCDGKAFLFWLMKKDFIVVDRLSSDGHASQFPPHMTASPRPSMDRPAPSTSTSPASKPAPAPSEDLSPADAPQKPAHPMDRPADPSI